MDAPPDPRPLIGWIALLARGSIEGCRVASAAAGGAAAAAEPKPKLEWADRAVFAALARLQR
jgi:hypothetical protein